MVGKIKMSPKVSSAQNNFWPRVDAMLAVIIIVIISCPICLSLYIYAKVRAMF